MLTYSEKTYNRVNTVGKAGIVLGIISIAVGLTVGILSIIFGGILLDTRKNLID